MTLDHLGGLELLVGKGLGIVALALECHLEAAEVLEHHHLTFGKGFDDVVSHTLQHRVAVGLRDGGAVVDALGELLHGELTRLDGGSVEVIYIGVLGISDLLYCVGNRHNFELKIEN